MWEVKKNWAQLEVALTKSPQKMGKIIWFYVNTHFLKSGPDYFVTFSHG